MTEYAALVEQYRQQEVEILRAKPFPLPFGVCVGTPATCRLVRACVEGKAMNAMRAVCCYVMHIYKQHSLQLCLCDLGTRLFQTENFPFFHSCLASGRIEL
jgi:hypothetical protein